VYEIHRSEKMKYYCKECGKSYTLPIGDLLIEKRKTCKCGTDAKLFALKKMIIVESRNWVGCDSFHKIT